MKTCDDMKGSLIELVFGELEIETETRLNQHLATCASCREEEKRLLAFRDRVRGESIPSAALRARIHARLPQRTSPRVLGIMSRPIPAYVAVAAAVLGAALVLLLPARERTGPSPVAPPSVRVEVAGHASLFTTAGSYETDLMSGGLDSVWNPASRSYPNRSDSL